MKKRKVNESLLVCNEKMKKVAKYLRRQLKMYNEKIKRKEIM